MYDQWVKHKETSGYCPLSHRGYIVINAMIYTLPPSGEIVGEFYFKDGVCIGEAYDDPIQIQESCQDMSDGR